MATFRKRGGKKMPDGKIKGGTWYYQIDRGPHAVGKRHISKGGFKTKKQAELAAAEVEKQLFEGTYVEQRDILFQELATEWFEEYSLKKKISTLRPRRNQLKHLLNYFFNRKARDITNKDYQGMLNDLHNQGYAFNTIDGIHSVGRMIFEKAMRDELIKKDPTQYAEVPKPPKTVEEIENKDKPPEYLEREELLLFLDTAKEKGMEKDYVIFLTLAYTGLRIGELVSLKWKDIDFDEGIISITKTMYNPDNNTLQYQLVPPKNEGSIREIEVDEDVISELKKLRASQNEFKLQHRDIYFDGNFVFTTIEKNFGHPILIKTVEGKMKRLLRLSGLNTNLTPHSLRHTHTSLCAEAGIPLEDIMERLGHADDKTTKLVYLHVTKARKKETARRFSEHMKGIKKTGI